MEFHFSPRAEKEYGTLTLALQNATDKQLRHLIHDLRHPSLHAKKYDEVTGLWQARVNRSWRFYFFMHGEIYYIVSITKHPK